MPAILDDIGLSPKDVFLVDQYAYQTGGIDAARLARIYSAMDVLLHPSYGEGFGLCILEAQACGTPVIAADNSSMPEVTGAGWLCGCDPFWDDDARAWYMRPAVGSIVDALNDSYEKARSLRDEAQRFALTYDIERVSRLYWGPVLTELDIRASQTRPKDPIHARSSA